jgi:cytoskeletal protein CcmA (bactofilin family)
MRRKSPSPARGPRAPAADSGFIALQTPPTVVAPDAPVTGRVHFSGPTRIDGRFRGEVRAADLLIIGESGSVEGSVRAPRVVVLGEVRGEVHGAERVEIGPRGRLSGAVATRVLVVSEGGRLDAECRMGARGLA